MAPGRAMGVGGTQGGTAPHLLFLISISKTPLHGKLLALSVQPAIGPLWWITPGQLLEVTREFCLLTLM